jgi:CheY-like chemotaxis protein
LGIGSEGEVRFVVVEDDLLVAETLKELLEAMGHEVGAVATTVSKAMAVVDATMPDMLMVDVNLEHGGNGIDVASYAYRHRGIRSMFVTGRPSASALSRIRPLDPVAVLVKPFSSDALSAALARAG